MSPPWRVVAASVKGPSHAGTSRPNQDRKLVRRIGRGGAWVYAVADGAGSRSRADTGALLAVEAAAAAAERVFGARTPAEPEDWQGAVRAFAAESLGLFDHAVAAEVAALPETGGESPQQLRSSFATTLLAVVAAPPFFGYFSVGDCFLVVDREPGGPHLVVAAPDREHAGETVFLTSARREAHLGRGVIVDSRIRGVALCSDGLSEGMLDIVQHADGRLQQRAPGEFSAYFDHFASPAVDDAELARKLLSKEFAATSGDDKTIVLAVRTT
ncbi:protein phosphatase 2C domain-containing protein [Amycolatopsis acidiphila]|uniref:Protein phosphatase 2C domain-containing protein n=1 Tax=Amycolatopsis acidiphila TaxID=715473 RepID=A0A557ZWS3_9PSEU|nr:protein phosphatase 2C domain-containing protein [Amycolatopsis acidiphila]TVT16459.1 protein phosphatase 2C domain-containing protein [Amycolatopsis acidiphila]UIJ57906.1 protein phosphatase 2C domain-containing protein [Amycolatopsis acidiphila]GHG71192.1 hypothetical protein GCM10017788_32940 [Amycolatopsis acidiphila]